MPSIVDGLFAGRAGIQSQGVGIAVVADNISNANTTGFKASRADFVDLLAGNLGGGNTVVTGSGSSVSQTTPVLTQGTFEFTGRGLDTGIDGNGFYVLNDPSTGQRFYSRAGNFKLDTDGNLLNQDGYQVLGFSGNGAGGLQALNVNSRTTASVKTNTVTIGGNLDATAVSPSAPPVTVLQSETSYQSLSNTANFSTAIDVFDSLGAKHSMTTYFFHTSNGNWRAQAYVDGGDVAGGVAGQAHLIGDSGAAGIQFSTAGKKTLPVSGTADLNASVSWVNGSTANQPIAISLDPMTQFAGNSSIDNLSQDGTGTGDVVGFSVQPDGTLFAQLDNGQTSSIGAIALANFAQPEGLKRVGGSVFTETSTSGSPVVGHAGTGTFGKIQSGALELSNSDIAADFIKLISLQRGFQGSSRIITSINDLLSEIINLAR